MSILSENIKTYRKKNKLTQKKLAEILGVAPTAVSAWELGRNNPLMDNIEQMAKAFNIKKSILLGDTLLEISSQLPPLSQESAGEIQDIYNQLEKEKNKTALISYGRELLEKEQEERKLKLDIQVVSETFKVYYTSAAKAGPTGFGYDDYEMDFTYSDQEPPRHDIATMVDGDSMNPDYADGDILYLRDYGASFYDGQECVVVIDDKSYFKKLYTTDTGLRLVSTNPDKDTYPDFEIDFPPADGSHIKIFDVVGSFTPVKK